MTSNSRFKKSAINGSSNNELLTDILDHLDVMVGYWDIDQICVFVNSASHLWFGKTRQQLIGMTLEELLGPLYIKNLDYIQAAYSGKIQILENEIANPDGTVRKSHTTYTPRIINREVVGIFVHIVDVTPIKNMEISLREAMEETEHLATHDFLTGLPNRVLFLDRMNQALALSKRHGRMVAVINLDIDDFKNINETYGHAVGDSLLIGTASRIKQVLRDYDSITRIGGDEFLLLIPDIDSISQIETLAARILSALNTVFQFGKHKVSTSCSLGVALCKPHEDIDPSVLITRSDKALNFAKKNGKNRYSFADNE